MEARTDSLRRPDRPARAELWLPAAGAAVAVATIAYGLVATASGARLGTHLPPFAAEWRPTVGPDALPALVLLAAAVALAPRLRSPSVSPLRFAATTLALGLALRLALAAARGGVDAWWAVYQLPNFEAANEYLPALPALAVGTHLFLDTFAEVGSSLPVNAIGHPPGLLLLLHWLDVDGARGMAALTIGVGALSIPLAYALARTLLDERRARVAALLYVFAPSALLYGATSADALYVTAALLAAVPLAAALQGRAVRWTLPAGAGLLAVAGFLSYANLAIGAWAALTALVRGDPRRAVAVAGACGLVLAGFYGLLYLGTGYDPIGVVRATEAVYREGVASGRPYAYWLLGSPVAALVALGPPVAWYALRAAGAGFAPAVALLAVLAIAAVLGFTKAETERIYQFLVPAACLAAAASLPPRRLPPVLGLLAAQALAVELLLDTVW